MSYLETGLLVMENIGKIKVNLLGHKVHNRCCWKAPAFSQSGRKPSRNSDRQFQKMFNDKIIVRQHNLPIKFKIPIFKSYDENPRSLLRCLMTVADGRLR